MKADSITEARNKDGIKTLLSNDEALRRSAANEMKKMETLR
jgi:hypothetical protein